MCSIEIFKRNSRSCPWWWSVLATYFTDNCGTISVIYSSFVQILMHSPAAIPLQKGFSSFEKSAVRRPFDTFLDTATSRFLFSYVYFYSTKFTVTFCDCLLEDTCWFELLRNGGPIAIVCQWFVLLFTHYFLVGWKLLWGEFCCTVVGSVSLLTYRNREIICGTLSTLPLVNLCQFPLFVLSLAWVTIFLVSWKLCPDWFLCTFVNADFIPDMNKVNRFFREIPVMIVREPRLKLTVTETGGRHK